MPFTFFDTAFGTCGLAWGEAGISGFALPDVDDAHLTRRLNCEAEQPVSAENAPDWIQTLIADTRTHLAGRVRDLDISRLDWSQVSDFQRAVYEHTHAIKPGFKKSYGEIARLMGLGNEAARAVGMALGSNPWPLIVPCHRVVSASNKMTGFSGPGGVRTKTRLLAMEGAELLSE